jgi:cobalt transporter subunit CbtA
VDAFRRIFIAAGLGGLVAGLLLAALHSFATVPLILEAETYERAAATATPAAHDHAEGARGPEDGLQRMALTAVADVLAAVGFGLLLVAGYVLAGREVGPGEGLRWGLAGFATFALAPALGLPPELPGAEAAPLLDRQAWWLATAAATGGGLALVCLAREARWATAGVALLALPHAYGAPQPAEHGHGLAPEALARDFAAASLVTGLLFWAALGSLTGLLHRRLGGAAAPGGSDTLAGQGAG